MINVILVIQHLIVLHVKLVLIELIHLHVYVQQANIFKMVLKSHVVNVQATVIHVLEHNILIVVNV